MLIIVLPMWTIWKEILVKQSSPLLVVCLCQLSKSHFWVRFSFLHNLFLLDFIFGYSLCSSLLIFNIKQFNLAIKIS